jgi:hypothetical protein
MTASQHGEGERELLVTNAIKSAVKLEPEIFHQQTPASPCPLWLSPGPRRFGFNAEAK